MARVTTGGVERRGARDSQHRSVESLRGGAVVDERPHDRAGGLPRAPGSRRPRPLLRQGLHRRARPGACRTPCRRSSRPAGWRIYTIAASMPNIDPAAYRLRVERARRQAGELLARRPQGDAPRGAGLRLPLRHRLVGVEGALGRCPAPRPARARRCQERCGGAAVRLGREALRGLADA